MTFPHVAVATITWARTPDEAALLLRSLERLSGTGLPLAVADTSKDAAFTSRLRTLPNVRVTVPESAGLVPQTPEYLAAGRSVVSTSIRDVVRPYGQQGLVRIADAVPEFIGACQAAMTEQADGRITRVDAFLRQTSWDGTWSRIRFRLAQVLDADAVEGAREAAEGATAV